MQTVQLTVRAAVVLHRKLTPVRLSNAVIYDVHVRALAHGACKGACTLLSCGVPFLRLCPLLNAGEAVSVKAGV